MKPPKRNRNTGKSMRTLPTSQPTPPHSRRPRAEREGRRVQKRGLYLGTFLDGHAVYLKPERLATHLHLIGPTGQGKSRMLL
jgi:hypothetical protein